MNKRQIVAKAIELTLPALHARGQMPHLALPDAPVAVQGDPLRLAQIVGNLLNNAVKFTQPDERIDIVLRTHDGHAELTVADAGIGIAPELLTQVFERFVQGEQQLQRAAGGLGLGLAIARSLARLHGGTIEAHSAGAGQGSSFIVRLPLARDEAPAALPAEAAPTDTRPRLKLLLVDDNRDALVVLADWLTLEGHDVSTADSAETALELMDTTRFDAGIFDIGLPGLSGHDLARRVRADPRSQGMVLVALTGYGQESDRSKALAAGFDAHFPKPPDLERIQDALYRT